MSIPGWSWDGRSIPGIPGYSNRGGGGVSCVHPRMILGWSEYPRKSMYRQVSGVFSIPSSYWDHTEDVLVT